MTAEKFPPPDWTIWGNKLFGTLEEAVLLSLNVEPTLLVEGHGYSQRPVRVIDCLPAAIARRDVAEDHLNNGLTLLRWTDDGMHVLVELAQFREWGESLPKRIEFPESFPRRVDASTKTIEPAIPPFASIDDSETLTSKERNVLLKIVALLLKKAYDVAPGELPRDIVGKVKRFADTEQVALSDDTLRKHLRAALQLAKEDTDSK